MEKVTHTNDFIRSLPRIVRKKVWMVKDKDGKVIQGVSATDNQKRTAQSYIDQKYPGHAYRLIFSHYGDLIAIPRSR